MRVTALLDATIDVESTNSVRNLRILVAGPLRGASAQGLFVLVLPTSGHGLEALPEDGLRSNTQALQSPLCCSRHRCCITSFAYTKNIFCPATIAVAEIRMHEEHRSLTLHCEANISDFVITTI